MNQTCKVCGEPAAGFHFGAFTCEGCKSFFGRSYNNLSSISECKNNGECVINKKNRTACKACRLRKCLMVGMSKSGSRYGRRSNWFKIHCLLQEQQQQAAAVAAAVHNNHNNQKTPPPPSALAMLGHPGAYPPGLYRPSCTKEELMLLGLDDYKHPAASPSVSSPDSHNSDSSVDVNVRSNTLLRLGKPMDANPMTKDLFLPLPFPGLSSLPVMPPPGFLPPSHLLFPGYHPALYSHHQGLLKPAAEHHHMLNNSHLANNNSRYALNHNNNNHLSSLSNNNNNLNNNHIQSNTKAAEELTKRFYLDAVLKSQQRSPVATTTVTTTSYTTTPTPIHSDTASPLKRDHDHMDDERHSDHQTHNSHDDGEDENIDAESEELVVAMTPPRSPARIMQDDPIDLSMKTGSSNSSKSSIASIDDNRHLSGGESDIHSEDNDDDDETTTTTITTTIQKRPQFLTTVANALSEDDEETEYERDMKRMKMTTTPLDLTTRV